MVCALIFAPLEIKRVVDFVLSNDVRVIFPEKNLSQDSLKKVVEACRSKGAKVKLSHETLYGDTMGGKSYDEMQRHNAEVIYRNLGDDNE